MLFGQQDGKSRLQQAQEDVEEVTDIMLDNLNKANERGVKLEDLEDRADELLEKVTWGYFSSSGGHLSRASRTQAARPQAASRD